MNRLILSSSLSFFLLASTATANTTLPTDVADALVSAHATNNRLVIDATEEKLVGIFPHLRQQIINFDHTSYTLEETVLDTSGETAQFTPEQLNNISTAAGAEEDPSRWSGSVEGGLSIATGNTEEENVNAKGELAYEAEHWKNTVKGSARNEKDNNIRTAEDYRIENQLDYKINERHYIFAEAGYVDDRFSGYDYRINEGVGYGYHFIKQDDMSLVGEVGVGGRHSKLISGDKEDEVIGKLSESFDWDINDRLTFEQEASVSSGEELTIINAAVGLKADIHKSLYLKLGFEVENLSDVPAGTDKTDTLTTVNLGYDF